MFDVVVVGGGPMGLSTAYNCSKSGKKVLVLEQFVLYNQSGSSNDLVRMFRTMYTEEYMARLAYKSMDLWNQLEEDAGEKLREMSGLLNFGDPTYKSGPEGDLTDPEKNLKRLNMKYQELTVKEIEQQFPFKNLPSFYKGLWAPDNGCINVTLVLRKLAELSRKYGTEIMEYAKVKEIMVINEEYVQVEVERSSASGEIIGKDTFKAKACAITPGAYVNHILEPSFHLKLNVNIWEMVYAYYACDPQLEYKSSSGAEAGTVEALNGFPFKSMWFQFAKNDSPTDQATSNLFYGFPSVPWGPPNLAHIAVDNAVRQITDPNNRLTNPSDYDIERTRKFIRDHTVGVNDRPSFAGTCLQTNLPDNMFVLDYIPTHRNVVVFTGGWGFKFVPLIGLILKQLLFDGGTSYDISHFKITRCGVIVED